MSAVKHFFESASFAVVGATNRPEKWGYKVYKRLQKLNKPVFPVHPALTEIEGEKVFPNLSALNPIPEAVNIIVSPSITEKVVMECNKLGIKKVWIQPGAESQAAIDYCLNNNIEIVYDDCVLRHPEF